MFFIRPVTENDHAEILNLATEAGIGMTSLPADAEVLERKIARAVGSFAGAEEWQGNEMFLFALQEAESGKLVGTTGVVAHVGMTRPFYSYKLSTIVQAYKPLEVYSMQRVLHMVNDYTGATEIGSLFLSGDYRRDGLGKFLSRVRYLMMAEFPESFSDIVISEIRGEQDSKGESPFYKNLAQHFFGMPFAKADFINATQGSQFISDLMPKYPIYVNLLAEEAQNAIGKPLAASLPAKQLLQAEGFSHQGYIDVFDGGPTMQAERAGIRTVRKSSKKIITDIRTVEGEQVMISNCSFGNFRGTLAMIEIEDAGVVLDKQTAECLQVGKGDAVRYCYL